MKTLLLLTLVSVMRADSHEAGQPDTLVIGGVEPTNPAQPGSVVDPTAQPDLVDDPTVQPGSVVDPLTQPSS